MYQPLLSKDLIEIGVRVKAAASLSLFLDFDGTLAPIVCDPAMARLEEPTRQALAEISQREDVLITIVSGRAIEDIRSRVGIEDLIYAGNHGLEIQGRGIRFVEPFAAAQRVQLHQLSDKLAANLRRFRGVLVEYKGLTASVHLRRVAQQDVVEIRGVTQKLLAPQSETFKLATGNLIMEILPRTAWDKGAAVLWITRRAGKTAALPVYMGDDRTDEDAFRVLPDAVTVKVGNGTMTHAKYRVASPTHVHEFLAWLAREKPKTAGSRNERR